MATSDSRGRLARRRRLRRPSQRLRIGLIQLVCAAGGLILALLAAASDIQPTLPTSNTASVMLTVAFSVVSLVTIIFSLLFTVVQWTYSTFSLRLRRFEDQSLTWWVFGLTIGVFIFTLVAAVLTARADRISWVVPGITFLGTLVALILMRRIQLTAFASVQLGPTLQVLCERGLRVVAEVYPDPYPGGDAAAPGAEDSPAALDTAGLGAGVPVAWQGPPAILQQLDEAALVHHADAVGARVRLCVGVGSFVAPGDTVAEVFGPPVPALQRCWRTGSDRTFSQDPLLAVRLIVDIALKALSPAVNDPATAVQAMDALTPILASLADRDLAVGALFDAAGDMVVEVPVPTFEEIVAHAVDDLVVCAAPLPLAARRLRAMLAELLERAPAERRPALQARLDACATRVSA